MSPFRVYAACLEKTLACRSRISFARSSPVITDCRCNFVCLRLQFSQGAHPLSASPSPPPPSTNSILISVTGDHIKSKGNGITPSREKLFDLRFEGHFFRLLLPPFAGRARTVATQDSSDFMSRIVWSRLSSSEHIRGDFLMGFKVQQQSRATYPLHNSHGIVLIKFEDAKRMSLLRGRLLSRLIADPLK